MARDAVARATSTAGGCIDSWHAANGCGPPIAAACPGAYATGIPAAALPAGIDAATAATATAEGSTSRTASRTSVGNVNSATTAAATKAIYAETANNRWPSERSAGKAINGTEFDGEAEANKGYTDTNNDSYTRERKATGPAVRVGDAGAHPEHERGGDPSRL